VLGISEVACHEAVSEELDPGQITVGIEARIQHRAPSRVGAQLEARATLISTEHRRLTFEVEVYDNEDLVATIEHVRAIVERQRILDRL
jgi:predicted thioesterase